MRHWARGLAGIGVALACVAAPAAAVPAPDAERLVSLRESCGRASAVRVVTTRGSFTSDHPSLDEAGVRLSTPGGRPALISDRIEPLPGRLLEWSDIEQVDTGRRLVARRTLIGAGIGALGAALLLQNGPDLSADGDKLMLLFAGFSFGAGTVAGYLFGTGYPVWSRMYP
jgi:hypothetical protein